VAAQFFQPTRTNPATEPDSSFAAVARPPVDVVSIVNRSCGDCHSNGTVWPWYSNVSPASWLVAQDVKEGRVHLNFSEWTRVGPEMARTRIRKACEQARDLKMPPWYYLPLHPAATLSQSDIGALCTMRWSGDGTSLAGSRWLVGKAEQLAILEQPYLIWYSRSLAGGAIVLLGDAK
jgi:hypothetical protein